MTGMITTITIAIIGTITIGTIRTITIGMIGIIETKQCFISSGSEKSRRAHPPIHYILHGFLFFLDTPPLSLYLSS